MTPRPTRRTFVRAAALLPIAAAVPSVADATGRHATGGVRGQLLELERTGDARIGVFAAQAGNRRTVGFRADERFPFCSTLKTLAVAMLLRKVSVAGLDRVVRYTAADVVANSPVTGPAVATGLSLRQLCDAAIRFSDNTAANLIVRELGGPAALTADLRRVGDRITRSDRYETALNTAVPGDPRDTSTPATLGGDYARFALGRVLGAPERAALLDWLQRNTTGDALIRKIVPPGWTVGDKTGSGEYGTRNDVAVILPPRRPAIALAVLTTHRTPTAATDDALVARSAEIAPRALTGRRRAAPRS